MAYRLQADEPLDAGTKRIAREQIDRALEQLNAPHAERDAVVHSVRKRFKKIRALLRLVRDAIGEDVYKRENVCFRDAGRLLAGVRDAAVLVKTLEDMNHRHAAQLVPGTFEATYQRLLQRRHVYNQRTFEERDTFAEVAETLAEARARVEQWPVGNEGFSTIEKGLRRVYRRGRHRMDDAYFDPLPENFHDWRKRVKYLMYQLRILRPLWPAMFKKLERELHNVSDYLGLDHDLFELYEVVVNQRQQWGDIHEVQTLLAFIDRERYVLEKTARPLGERIYLEKPKLFVKRLNGYWDVWQAALRDQRHEAATGYSERVLGS